jgi:tetratricopeptide (TPR) repeat protein
MVGPGMVRAMACVALLGVAAPDGGDGEKSEKLEKLLNASLLDTLTGDYAEAVDSLELIEEVSEDESLNRRVARLLDRAQRSLAFVDRLPALLAVRSAKDRPQVQFRDGTIGRYVGADSLQIVVENDREQETRSTRELTPASILFLSNRVALSSEDALGRAFVALSEKDEKVFWAGVERASGDARLKRSIDSAIAYQKNLDSVPPGGFVRVGAAWKSGAELTLKREIGDASKFFALIHSPKAAEADAARAKLDELLRANPEGMKAWAMAQRDELRAAFEKAPESKTLALLHERVASLKGARESALKLIFDEVKYFYPYRVPECPPDKAATYGAVQQEVDELVARVRAIWGEESAAAPEPSIRSATFLNVVGELHELRTILCDLGVVRDEVDKALAPCWLLPAHADAITVRNLAGDVYDVSRLNHDELVLASNRALDPATAGAAADELRQLEITNLYRAMMGRRLLLWSGKLRNAARGHSEWMERTATFRHEEESGSPRETPSDRARLAGYPGGAAENIEYGEADAMRAHVGWLHSSGHHRNILMIDHTEFGDGHVGTYWTQNFGDSLDYKAGLVGVKR